MNSGNGNGNGNGRRRYRSKVEKEKEALPGKRPCPICEQWLHYSRFRPNARQGEPCRDCERGQRQGTLDEQARAIVYRRATQRASKLGVPNAFLLVTLGWEDALVPLVRVALADPTIVCRSCRQPFKGHLDIQLDHTAPPTGLADWAREDARNIGLLCATCNKAKKDKAHDTWLNDVERARIENEAHRLAVDMVPLPPPVVVKKKKKPAWTTPLLEAEVMCDEDDAVDDEPARD